MVLDRLSVYTVRWCERLDMCFAVSRLWVCYSKPHFPFLSSVALYCVLHYLRFTFPSDPNSTLPIHAPIPPTAPSPPPPLCSLLTRNENQAISTARSLT